MQKKLYTREDVLEFLNSYPDDKDLEYTARSSATLCYQFGFTDKAKLVRNSVLDVVDEFAKEGGFVCYVGDGYIRVEANHCKCSSYCSYCDCCEAVHTGCFDE